MMSILITLATPEGNLIDRHRCRTGHGGTAAMGLPRRYHAQAHREYSLCLSGSVKSRERRTYKSSVQFSGRSVQASGSGALTNVGGPNPSLKGGPSRPKVRSRTLSMYRVSRSARTTQGDGVTPPDRGLRHVRTGLAGFLERDILLLGWA
ncbi:hypothetical protein M407DRAFT_117505 [Tulasnella calospora MUT 4182]|uniref:Uncharacterized protein n=1 Tax=Tulasnella calospora MUT 4182 TaxID=1051891 RepID=A0A0C3KMB2_9AGAM|nr:hypothetical protein M407DRAFT_117505 [Tulasnella calospora MUT 4182]